jgi:WD40 repeat protein
VNLNNRDFLPVALVLVALLPESGTASADDYVRLPAAPEMDFQTQREFRNCYPASCVAFSPNGLYLASADTARSICLWDLKSRKKAWEAVLSPVGAVSEEEVDLAFTADGKTLLLASYVRDPLVLDASSGKTLRTIGHEGKWFAPAISLWRKDGTETAVTSSSGDLHFWNPSNGKEVMALKGAGNKVNSLQVAKNMARIALVLWVFDSREKWDTGRVMVRELPSGRIIFDVQQSGFPVRQVAISPNGEYVFAASSCLQVGASEGKLVCWSIERKERLWSTNAICGGLAMSPDGKMLAYGSGSRIVLCDVPSGTTLSSARYGSHTIDAVTFADDGTFIAIGAADGAVAVWKLLRSHEETGPGHKSGARLGR